MDLLPTINKAYAMVLSDAKQKGVYLGTGNQSYNDAALNVHVTANKRNNKDGGKHTKEYPSTNPFLDSEWIVDAGASNHMTSCFETLMKCQTLENPSLVYLPNNASVYDQENKFIAIGRLDQGLYKVDGNCFGVTKEKSDERAHFSNYLPVNMSVTLESKHSETDHEPVFDPSRLQEVLPFESKENVDGNNDIA
ncbi:unnamed protein product [Citrullus colocynthis]|uniref:Uncharacterized protein n=1 Tax=Citrullus colocynthis TaxID=252529 RepID=A0ABP0XXX6_9ROSI